MDDTQSWVCTLDNLLVSMQVIPRLCLGNNKTSQVPRIDAHIDKHDIIDMTSGPLDFLMMFNLSFSCPENVSNKTVHT